MRCMKTTGGRDFRVRRRNSPSFLIGPRGEERFGRSLARRSRHLPTADCYPTKLTRRALRRHPRRRRPSHLSAIRAVPVPRPPFIVFAPPRLVPERVDRVASRGVQDVDPHVQQRHQHEQREDVRRHQDGVFLRGPVRPEAVRQAAFRGYSSTV